MINIKGLDKAEVLLALYKASHTQGLGFLQAVDNYTLEDARRDYEASHDKYFDYLHGRVLKVDLSGDEFDERLFDRDCGPGAAANAIDALARSKEKDRVSPRYTRKNFRQVSAFYHDEDYPDYDMIDLMETYEKLKDDSKDQQYIITREDLEFIMVKEIRDFEAEVYDAISDFIYSVRKFEEFNASNTESDKTNRKYIVTEITLKNMIASDYLHLDKYRVMSVQKLGIYKILPYSFKDSYEKLTKDVTEELDISYDKVFGSPGDFLTRIATI